MPLFVERKETKQYVQFRQKKFVNIKTTIAYLIILSFIIPFIASFFLSNNIAILFILCLYFIFFALAIWFAFEKVYYSTTYPKKLMREGKKVIYEEHGVKIYK